MAKPLTIIMVGRDNLDATKKAIESLVKYTEPQNYRLIFCAVDSGPETESWVQHYCKDHGVECRLNGYSENVGWITAVNQAYNLVETEYSLTCHNDVVFAEQWLDRMMRRFTDKTVAAVGPVITFAMGPQAQAYSYMTFGCEVKYLLGLFFMCRQSVLRQVKELTGNYLEPAYGLGDKEELELCHIIHSELGYKFDIARDVIIEHEGEKSFIKTLGSKQAFIEYQNKKLELLKSRLGEDAVNEIFRIEIKNQIKLMVGILTRTEYVHYQNVISLLKVWGFTTVPKTFYHIARGHPAMARNQIVREFLKTDCTHLLFIDDDMVFDHDAINKLFAMDVDIATGVAYQRGEPHAPCIFLFNPESKTFHPVETAGKGINQVDAIGGYFFLVKRKVFEEVSKPWFIYGDTSLGFNDSDDPDNRGIGEDVYFSSKARLAGFEIWVDGSLEIRHIGNNQIIDTKFFDEYKVSERFAEVMKARDTFKLM